MKKILIMISLFLTVNNCLPAEQLFDVEEAKQTKAERKAMGQVRKDIFKAMNEVGADDCDYAPKLARVQEYMAKHSSDARVLYVGENIQQELRVFLHLNQKQQEWWQKQEKDAPKDSKEQVGSFGKEVEVRRFLITQAKEYCADKTHSVSDVARQKCLEALQEDLKIHQRAEEEFLRKTQDSAQKVKDRQAKGIGGSFPQVPDRTNLDFCRKAFNDTTALFEKDPHIAYQQALLSSAFCPVHGFIMEGNAAHKFQALPRKTFAIPFKKMRNPDSAQQIIDAAQSEVEKAHLQAIKGIYDRLGYNETTEERAKTLYNDTAWTCLAVIEKTK